MAVGIVSLIVLVVVIVIALPVLSAVFGQATKQNPNDPEEKTKSKEHGRRSGHGGRN